MPTIVISGAGSGIGHAFLAHLSADEKNTIHALDIAWPEEPSRFAAEIKRHTISTTDASAVTQFAESLASRAINLLIHSAGVRGLVPGMVGGAPDPKAAETLEVMNHETMMSCLDINITGSFLLIRALVPALKQAGGRCVVMGSRMGSIGANTGGGAYAYRASKVGLNSLVKSFSIDVPEVIFTSVHPGRVESRLTPNREEGAIDAAEAVSIMMPVIERLTKKNSGSFYTRDGENIPW